MLMLEKQRRIIAGLLGALVAVAGVAIAQGHELARQDELLWQRERQIERMAHVTVQNGRVRCDGGDCQMMTICTTVSTATANTTTNKLTSKGIQ